MGDVNLTSFAYPFGDMSWGAKQFLQRRFASCRTTTGGVNRGLIDASALRAERLYSNSVTPERAVALIQNAIRERGWLIFYTHDVSSNPSPFGTTAALLAAAIDACTREGVEILTVKNALARMAFGK